MPRQEAKEKIESLVRKVPRGRVITYGQVATLLGMPRAARAVGWTAHFGATDVPWQRVVNRHGRVAPGWPGGMAAHAAALDAEGLSVNENWEVDLARYQWLPSPRVAAGLELSPEALESLRAKLPLTSETSSVGRR